MKVKALTDIGLIRKKNQDAFFLSEKEDQPLFIIADGMGGHWRIDHVHGLVADRDPGDVHRLARLGRLVRAQAGAQ